MMSTFFPSYAEAFEVEGLYYNILSEDDGTVEVTYFSPENNQYAQNNQDYVKGALEIPDKVRYNNKSYTVTGIGWSAFYTCKGLESVKIPDSVTKIDAFAFSYCSNLGSVEIPTSVITIAGQAFSYCNGLKSVTIGNSVTTIGASAFFGCAALTSVIIPNSVTEISENTFCGCTNLASVTIGNSVNSISGSAFSNCPSLSEIYVDQNNPCYSASQGALFNKDMTTLIKVGEGKNGVFIIPSSVKTIGDEAFSQCTGLTSVIIPNSVTTIGARAFLYCSGLTSVTIGNSVSEIGDYTFLSCYELKQVYCSASTPPSANEPFENRTFNGTLYVPVGSKAEYEKVSPWNKFQTIEEYNFTPAGIESIGPDSNSVSVQATQGNINILNKCENDIVRVYTIQGNLIAETKKEVVRDIPKGLFIVTVGNKSFKVTMR